MKIIIKAENKNIYLPLPLFFLKRKFIWKFILDETSKSNKETTQFIRRIIREIKIYKKRNGRFVLLEVHTTDGEYIKITI